MVTRVRAGRGVSAGWSKAAIQAVGGVRVRGDGPLCYRSGVSMFHRRQILAGAAGAAIAMRLPNLSDAHAAAADTLEIAQPWEIKSLIPREGGYHWTRAGVTQTLVTVEPDGSLSPCLATSWNASEDARIWRFNLRPGVLFHDGTPADPAAILDAVRRLLPKSQYPNTAGITSVELDGATLVIRTSAPFALMPAYMTDNSMPILARASFDDKNEVVRMIGTGPFKVNATDLPRSLKLSRHDAYWGKKASYARANFQAVANGETRANIAVAGDADAVFNLPNPSVARVSGAGQMRIDRIVVPRTHILMPNVAMPQFAEAATRRALSMAIDRTAIATTIMRNPALAATHYLPPTFKDWAFRDIAPLSHDPVKANKLLDEAGWVRGADGIRAKNGKRFAGTVKTFVNRPELPVIAAALQDQFRQVGFDLMIKVGDFMEIVDAQKDGSLELGLSSRNVAIVPDPVATIRVDFNGEVSPGGAVGATNWKNQPILDAIAAYTQTADAQRLSAARRQVVSILQDELPVIPICWYENIVAVRNGVTGFVNDPFDQRYFMDRLQPKA